ncbi:MAG TPA: mechanosensitive ion channel family protein [Kofleriaceae bacterium]|jgi:small-conductance mechanosensitive channel/CRP-like cAMP-binding protein
METYETTLYWACGMLAGVLLVAALVNAVRPNERARLRRLVVLFALYLIAAAGAIGFDHTDSLTLQRVFTIASSILRAFLIVNLASTIVFAIALPVVGVVLPMIASDLLVGVGYIASVFDVLAQHGVDPTSALVSGAVVSAVLAISLQSTLGNLMGGIALQLDGSIHEGDWIQLPDGKQGKVYAVRWRHTIVQTRDWSQIVVPNAQLLQSNIILLGKRDGRTTGQRMWVWFNVDFRFAPTHVIDVVTDAVLDSPIENVCDEPRPNVVCMDFTHDGRESVATYAVRYWLKDLAFDDPTNSRVRGRVYTALKRAGIPLAIPAQTVLAEIHDAERVKQHASRELDARLAAIETVKLFTSFKEDELRKLAEGMSRVVYVSGERITRQGAVAHWLYVMTSGRAEIRIKDPEAPAAEPTIVAKVSAPDFFGEMGLMTGEPRTADVIAIGDVECYRLGKAPFESVLLGRPEIVEELSEKLATRRVELIAVKEGLDAEAKRKRHDHERERILGGIKAFFGL